MKNPLLLSIASSAALVTALSSCGSAEPEAEPAAQDTGNSQEAAGTSAPDSAQPSVLTMPTAESQSSKPAQVPSSASVPPGQVPSSASAPPSSPAPSAGQVPPSSETPASISPPTRVDGVGSTHGASFRKDPEGAVAITYDPGLVPVGSLVVLTRTMGVNSTSMSVEVEGLQPNQKYGAHVHMDTCGATAEDAGPRYEHQPSQSSTASGPDMGNEIWMPFVTDSQGRAESNATVNWPVRPGEGHSLVFHADTAASEDPLGDRVACFVLGRTAPPPPM